MCRTIIKAKVLKVSPEAPREDAKEVRERGVEEICLQFHIIKHKGINRATDILNPITCGNSNVFLAGRDFNRKFCRRFFCVCVYVHVDMYAYNTEEV